MKYNPDELMTQSNPTITRIGYFVIGLLALGVVGALVWMASA